MVRDWRYHNVFIAFYLFSSRSFFCVKKPGVGDEQYSQSVAFCVACYGFVAQMRCMRHVCSLFQGELSDFNTAKFIRLYL